jgi:hypothetical protein
VNDHWEPLTLVSVGAIDGGGLKVNPGPIEQPSPRAAVARPERGEHPVNSCSIDSAALSTSSFPVQATKAGERESKSGMSTLSVSPARLSRTGDVSPGLQMKVKARARQPETTNSEKRQ